MGTGRKRRAESRYLSEAVRLGRNLRKLRIRAELTQEQLAVRAQIAVSTLRKIESATVVEPGYFTIMALLKVLGASNEDLI